MTLNCQTSEDVVKKILLSLYISKAARMDQIQAKFLRDGAELLILSLRNIIKCIYKIIDLPKGVKSC